MAMRRHDSVARTVIAGERGPCIRHRERGGAGAHHHVGIDRRGMSDVIVAQEKP
jgi:hypothetical protein